jgi:hypothetical protein
MHDPYALKLFSIADCLDCMEQDCDLALMYLLIWALQEESIRSPQLSRQDLLENAFLSFHLLLHYFDLSFLPRSEGITQPFDQKRTWL